MASPTNFLAVLAFLLISLYVLHSGQADQMVNSKLDAESPPTIVNVDCGSACAARCELSSRPNLCNRACGTCCYRCKCVPPGTAGHYEACPCYANMTTHGGRRKCP